MAKKKKEEVVEKTAEDNVTKVSLKKENNDDNIIKVDLTKKPETDAVPEQSTDEVPVRDESETSEKVLEENVETTDEKPTGEEVSDTVQDEAPALEEITQEQVEEKVEEKVEDKVEGSKEVNNKPNFSLLEEIPEDNEVKIVKQDNNMKNNDLKEIISVSKIDNTDTETVDDFFNDVTKLLEEKGENINKDVKSYTLFDDAGEKE